MAENPTCAGLLRLDKRDLEVHIKHMSAGSRDAATIPGGGRRNFRAAYLDHLGVKNVRHSYDALLNEHIIDISHLKKLCQKFEVPQQLRATVWKILSGFYPAHREAWSFIDEQNQEMFKDLKTASNLIDTDLQNPPQAIDSAPLSPARQLSHVVRLWQYMNAAPFDDSPEDLEKIFEALMTVYSNEADCVSLAFNLLNLKRNRNQIVVKRILKLVRLLETHEADLWTLLQIKEVQVESIFKRWFLSCFACIMPSKSLPLFVAILLWDRVWSSPGDFQCHLALHILSNMKRKIASQSADPKAIRELLLSEITSSIEPITLKALETFQSEENTTVAGRNPPDSPT